MSYKVPWFEPLEFKWFRGIAIQSYTPPGGILLEWFYMIIRYKTAIKIRTGMPFLLGEIVLLVTFARANL